MDTPDVDLPQFLDPLLDYLASVLPPNAYDILVSLVSHSISLFTSLFSLVKALASSRISSWDAQVILPPLITLLAAYLALVSFYRTTSWMIRTGIWFAKWGTILSAVAAGAGWMLGNANANGDNGVGGLFGGAGILPTVGALIMDMINGQGQTAADGSRSTRQSRSWRSRTQKQQAPRPKAWESWDRHQEWQYNENAHDDGSEGVGESIQKIVGDIFGAATGSGWWEAAKGVANEFSQGMQGEGRDEVDPQMDSARKQPSRNAKRKARTNANSR